MSFLSIRMLTLALVSLLALTGTVHAQTLTLVKEQSGREMVFELEDLQALPLTTIRTSTPWTEGEQVFDGIALKDLLAETGFTGTTILALALNDYEVEFPLSAALESRALIAYRRNGEAMSVREKGPYWIVFPYDDISGDQVSVRAWSVWQLVSLTLLSAG